MTSGHVGLTSWGILLLASPCHCWNTLYTPTPLLAPRLEQALPLLTPGRGACSPHRLQELPPPGLLREARPGEGDGAA